MKRINRKEVLNVLEAARQGYYILMLKSIQIDDKIMYDACLFLHNKIRDQISDLTDEYIDAVYPPETFINGILKGMLEQ